MAANAEGRACPAPPGPARRAGAVKHRLCFQATRTAWLHHGGFHGRMTTGCEKCSLPSTRRCTTTPWRTCRGPWREPGRRALATLTLLDTVRTSPLSRWLDTRWTLVSECRAECLLSVDLVSIDTGVGVSGGVGRCRGLVSKCRARAQAIACLLACLRGPSGRLKSTHTI